MSEVTRRLVTNEMMDTVRAAIANLPNATQTAADNANAAATAAGYVNVSMTRSGNVITLTATDRTNTQTVYTITDPTGMIAGEFSSGSYQKGSIVAHNGTLYRFTSDHTGAWTGSDVTSTTVADVLDIFTARMALAEENIPNTTQTIVYDSDGNVSQIVHANGGTTVRTDAYTIGTDTITEVRTLATGQSLTIVTNLNTLVTTVTYAE